MKLAKTILSACTLAALGASVAQADVTIYITGATAYRNPAITQIKAYLTGGYKGIYGNKSGVTSDGNAANVIIRGTRTENPAFGVITFKCAWGGSVGGVKLIQSTTSYNIDDQPGVRGWIPDAALTGSTGNVVNARTETTSAPYTIVGDDSSTYAFEAGGTAAKPDAAFTDAFQSSALSGGDALPLGGDPNGKIGVIPFDIVVCNGVTPTSVTQFTGVAYSSSSTTITYGTATGATPYIGQTIGGKGIPVGTTITGTGAGTLTISGTTTSSNDSSGIISAADTEEAPINDISSIQLQQILTGGGRLAMFTGTTGGTGFSSGTGMGVYCYGRNSDSGTRISCLGESFKGILKNPSAHLIPTFNPAGSGGGKGGSPGALVSTLALWPAETILGVSYGDGGSGYTSGGDLADALSSPGAQLVTPTSFTRPGWIIGYLGRSDATRACQRTFGQNTAKRITFNGQKDWNGAGNANNVDGTPVGTSGVSFNDDAIREGLYQGWEFEHFYKNKNITAVSDKGTVLSTLATNIVNTVSVSGAIKLSTMHVTKSVEGGAISYP